MSQFISLEQAIKMTTLHRQEKENILGTAFKNQSLLPTCETFTREAIETLLQKKGCTGLRIYYGMDDAHMVHAILVAVDAASNDILPVVSMGKDIVEQGQRCPPQCTATSPLNKL